MVADLEFEIKRLKTQKATMKEDLAQYDNRMMLPFDLKVENLEWDDKDNFESHLVDVAQVAIISALASNESIKNVSTQIAYAMRNATNQSRWLCNIRPKRYNLGLIYHCKSYIYFKFKQGNHQYAIDIAQLH